MRILYLSSKKNWGGVTNWMNQTALGLERKGHQVWIMAHPNGRFVKSASRKLRIIPKKLGMDYNPYMVLFIWRLIVRNRIDLLVTNIEKEVMAGGLASRLSGIPNIRRVGREDDFNEKWRVKWHHRLLVDRCITPCNLIRDNALKRAGWLDGSMFTTIYNGRNYREIPAIQRDRQRTIWGIQKEALVIGITTQLSRVKGVDTLIRAFARLWRQHPHCRLVVTGEGGERRGLEALARELHVSDSVVFGGYASDPMLIAASYDIAVCSSLFEGFPNTVVEYLAAGRPVVSTDAGGIPEMVKHGVNGWLVPSGDEHKLYEGLLSLVEDGHLRTSLQQQARHTIQEKFSEDIMLEKLEAFFRQAIQKQRG
ncbi:MAG: glycosyltransferase family 4 protein [Deltaproteobacteria bacterium]|nr:glycosyltransferase family 4 protein [Deltaproteobacteria bacterium]